MPARPPHHPQMQYYSCAPACLRMVLESFGKSYPEAYLRELCKCDDQGTNEYDLRDAAIALGFTRSYTALSTLTALREELSRGLHPIVFIGIRDYLASNLEYGMKHAVVIVNITEDDINPQVSVLDPLGPAHPVLHPAFREAWAAMRNRLIVIDGPSETDNPEEVH